MEPLLCGFASLLPNLQEKHQPQARLDGGSGVADLNIGGVGETATATKGHERQCWDDGNRALAVMVVKWVAMVMCHTTPLLASEPGSRSFSLPLLTLDGDDSEGNDEQGRRLLVRQIGGMSSGGSGCDKDGAVAAGCEQRQQRGSPPLLIAALLPLS